MSEENLISGEKGPLSIHSPNNLANALFALRLGFRKQLVEILKYSNDL